MKENTQSSAFDFSLQPGASNIQIPVENLKKFQDCTFFCPTNTVEMFGNEIFVIGGHFDVIPVDWNGPFFLILLYYVLVYKFQMP